jgi:transposase
VGQARRDLAAELLADRRHLDTQLAESTKKLATVVKASGTTVTGLSGAGPVIAAIVIGGAGAVTRFPSRDHFPAWNGTAPAGVSSGGRKIYRLSLRGNRRLNHAIHMAAITQIRHKHSPGRAYYERKVAEGKTHKEALRCLKRRISGAIYAPLVADARRAAAALEDPGGQPGNGSDSSAAGSHPERRLFGHATPGPRRHPATAASSPGSAGPSPVAATVPPARPQVQVERPQRSEDERPGGAARRRPHSAARKAPWDPELASEATTAKKTQATT